MALRRIFALALGVAPIAAVRDGVSSSVASARVFSAHEVGKRNAPPEDWPEDAKAFAKKVEGKWEDRNQHPYMVNLTGNEGFVDFVGLNSTRLALSKVVFFEGQVGEWTMRFRVEPRNMMRDYLIAEKKEGEGLHTVWQELSVKSFTRVREVVSDRPAWSSSLSAREEFMAESLLGTWSPKKDWDFDFWAPKLPVSATPRSLSFRVGDDGLLVVAVDNASAVPLRSSGPIFEGHFGPQRVLTRVRAVEDGKRLIGEQQMKSQGISSWHVAFELTKTRSEDEHDGALVVDDAALDDAKAAASATPAEDASPESFKAWLPPGARAGTPSSGLAPAALAAVVAAACGLAQ